MAPLPGISRPNPFQRTCRGLQALLSTAQHLICRTVYQLVHRQARRELPTETEASRGGGSWRCQSCWWRRTAAKKQKQTSGRGGIRVRKPSSPLVLHTDKHREAHPKHCLSSVGGASGREPHAGRKAQRGEGALAVTLCPCGLR